MELHGTPEEVDISRAVGRLEEAGIDCFSAGSALLVMVISKKARNARLTMIAPSP